MVKPADIFTLRAKTRSLENGLTDPAPDYLSSHAEQVRGTVSAAREPGVELDQPHLQLLGELETWLRGYYQAGATAGS